MGGVMGSAEATVGPCRLRPGYLGSASRGFPAFRVGPFAVANTRHLTRHLLSPRWLADSGYCVVSLRTGACFSVTFENEGIAIWYATTVMSKHPGFNEINEPLPAAERRHLLEIGRDLGGTCWHPSELLVDTAGSLMISMEAAA